MSHRMSSVEWRSRCIFKTGTPVAMSHTLAVAAGCHWQMQLASWLERFRDQTVDLQRGGTPLAPPPLESHSARREPQFRLCNSFLFGYALPAWNFGFHCEGSLLRSYSVASTIRPDTLTKAESRHGAKERLPRYGS